MQEHIIFWLTKAMYALFYIAIPIYFVGVLPWLCGFFAMHLVKGFTLAMVFQLAHVVEDTHFVDATEPSVAVLLDTIKTETAALDALQVSQANSIKVLDAIAGIASLASKLLVLGMA